MVRPEAFGTDNRRHGGPRLSYKLLPASDKFGCHRVKRVRQLSGCANALRIPCRLWEQGVASSNPAAPTNDFNYLRVMLGAMSYKDTAAVEQARCAVEATVEIRLLSGDKLTTSGHRSDFCGGSGDRLERRICPTLRAKLKTSSKIMSTPAPDPNSDEALRLLSAARSLPRGVRRSGHGTDEYGAQSLGVGLDARSHPLERVHGHKIRHCRMRKRPRASFLARSVSMALAIAWPRCPWAKRRRSCCVPRRRTPPISAWRWWFRRYASRSWRA